ncbi:MAG: hypothetical protein A3F72_01645 [Bacteroidetes bacterium RIFCSPLOWO2_12_FULL_35_15]|nr:MAG: hypothetical protein A3F72_01645 [Bacteroidetes bacterium RIFCSPLOWO2_12_FULL_35_15]
MVLNVYSQNAKQDMIKINEAYSKFNDLAMNITYNLYPNYTATSPVETETGSFKQHESLRYSKLKGIESLQNKEYLVVVDNEEKLIVVSNPVKFNPGKITMVDLDKAFTNCSSIQFIDNKSALSGYKLTFKETIVSEFDAIDLYFNKKTFLVEKIVFYYREKIRVNEYDESSPKEKPKLEIVFSNMDFKTISDLTFFSENRFIEKRKGKYFPVSIYTNFEVFDQKLAK